MEEADEVTFADVHGHITLEPEPFDTTRVTMSAIVQLANLVRLDGVLASRVFTLTFSWRQEDDGSFLIAWAPVEEHPSPERLARTEELIRSDAAATHATRATTRGLMHFMALEPSVCQVTYLLQISLGGSIPKAFMTSRTKQALGSVQEMQAKFERKVKVVDAEMRSAFPLPPPLAELNDEQKLVVESCWYLESEEGGEWEPLPSSSPFVDMWYKHAPARRGERSIALWKATAGESPVQSADLFPRPPSSFPPPLSPLCSHMCATVLGA